MTAPGKSKKIVATFLASISLLVVGFAFWRMPPSIDKTLHSQIGRTLAIEALKLAKSGGKITIIARDTDAFPQPAMDVLLKNLQAQIREAGREIRSVQRIQLDPIRPSAVPSGDFYELLRRAPAGDVIISLLGPPMLLPEERARLVRPKAAVVAFCTGSENLPLEELFEEGLLHIALVNQSGAKAGTRKPLLFDQLYAVVRGKTAG